MKRLLIAIVVGFLGGSAFGFGTGIFIYPFWFLNDIASESLVENAARKQIATGEFIHANPSDPIHYGGGGVSVYEHTLSLEDDFEVGPGTKFHVYLVPKASVRQSADVEDMMFVDLGRLRAFKGSQNFSIPAGLDLKDYKSVVIWCEKFGVLISPADLAFN